MRRKTKVRRALVAVNDPEAHAAASKTLERDRYVVEAPAEWSATVAKIASEAYDVVIAEIEMPVVGGFDLLKAIRSNHPGTLVFLLGRNGSDENIRRATNLGAAGYLSMPVNEHKLSAQIKAARAAVRGLRPLKSLGIKEGRMKLAS